MTIKQYQKLAQIIATQIENLGGNPRTTRTLKYEGGVTIDARNPKTYKDRPVTFESGDSNFDLEFDTISNPNNPNYKFKTLKPGSMSVYDSKTDVNHDITEYNFDTAQFMTLAELIRQPGWVLVR